MLMLTYYTLKMRLIPPLALLNMDLTLQQSEAGKADCAKTVGLVLG